MVGITWYVSVKEDDTSRDRIFSLPYMEEKVWRGGCRVVTKREGERVSLCGGVVYLGGVSLLSREGTK